ncbi:hypothetical protein B0H11DRAFT_2236853 [Mycena galericulata]|nr:hypothetical protein B0H11DRAFT_2236853 [Mycena galericulata]
MGLQRLLPPSPTVESCVMTRISSFFSPHRKFSTCGPPPAFLDTLATLLGAHAPLLLCSRSFSWRILHPNRGPPPATPAHVRFTRLKSTVAAATSMVKAAADPALDAQPRRDARIRCELVNSPRLGNPRSSSSPSYCRFRTTSIDAALAGSGLFHQDPRRQGQRIKSLRKVTNPVPQARRCALLPLRAASSASATAQSPHGDEIYTIYICRVQPVCQLRPRPLVRTHLFISFWQRSPRVRSRPAHTSPTHSDEREKSITRSPLRRPVLALALAAHVLRDATRD